MEKMQPMRRIQESVGYTGKYRARTARSYDQDDGVKNLNQAALFLGVVGLVGPLVPQWGALAWKFGWVVCLVLLIISIMMMTKGVLGRGVLGLLSSVIVLPLWIAVAPLAVMVVNEGRGWQQALQEVMRQQGIAQSEVAPSDTAGASAGMNITPEGPHATTPVEDVFETITSKDGRTIRGTIVGYDTRGVQMKRDDGLVVHVGFELMSDADAQKFRDRHYYSGPSSGMK